MKKKIWIPAIVILLVLVLFVPVPTGSLNDGGTKIWSSLTYKIVKWNRLVPDGIYEKNRVYFAKDYFKSIDELWLMEEVNVEYSFNAIVLEVEGDWILVSPFENESEYRSADKISFTVTGLDVKVGDYVKVAYDGNIMETYPAKIFASKCEKIADLRNFKYQGTWINKDIARNFDETTTEDYVITDIYADCFFATPMNPMRYPIKINGTLSEEWCIGDWVCVTVNKHYCDDESNRVEGDLIRITASNVPSDETLCYKPVIYLYPKEETKVNVNLTLDGELTCTYPKYQNGWSVTASPDGTLTDKKGQTYNYLYWEGKTNTEWDFSEGFCVKGEDTARFLEDALLKLGLNRREANEFIVYWLPIMEENPYNIISFQTENYNDAAKLEISPKPDTLIRVFMAFKSSEKAVDIKEQTLSAPERNGFTAVEWGGTKVN